MTAEKFERDLQEDLKGFEIEKKIIHQFYRRKIEMIKSNSLTRIEALEVIPESNE